MTKLRYSSSLLRDRRIHLGYQPCEVATKIGVAQGTYRQWEHRGQVPENHLTSLATVLEISEIELLAEKIAVMVEETFGIPKAKTHGFIVRELR